MTLLFIVCIIYAIYQAIKNACTPVIPAENWANKELIYQDRLKGISEKQILKNVERGRYKL